MLGELIPLGGGDPIPLLKDTLRVGRRENCDIVLRFPNVSAHHCVLSVDEGYWFIKDLNSRNGVKVNGRRVNADCRKRIDPGDTVAIARHKYELVYQPADLGAVGVPPSDDEPNSVLKQSLLERAGLSRREDQENAAKGYDMYKNNADRKNRRKLE